MKTSRLIKVSVASVLLSGSLFAKECHNLSDIKIKWTSFKTLEKIGVSGNFFKYDLSTKRNAISLQDALQGSSIKLDLKELDAKMGVKTENIQNFFVKHLLKTDVDAKITKVYTSSLMLEITMNGVTREIPFSYKKEGKKVIGSGYFDAGDFDMDKPMHILATNVNGHMKKGWDDIPVTFTLNYSKKCN